MTLVYGMRLLPADEVVDVGEAPVKLKNGREAHVTMHVLEGSVLSHLGGKPDRILRGGDCSAEGKDITHHWMETMGTEPVKYISVDVTK